MRPNSKTKPILGPGPKDIWREARKSISLKQMKRFRKPNPWIHFTKGGLTLCGKKWPHRIDREFVTCPRCIEVLKESYWHCPEHGFIEDSNVTNDEKCETCGKKV